MTQPKCCAKTKYVTEFNVSRAPKIKAETNDENSLMAAQPPWAAFGADVHSSRGAMTALSAPSPGNTRHSVLVGLVLLRVPLATRSRALPGRRLTAVRCLQDAFGRL
jgi:hypothetical protein